MNAEKCAECGAMIAGGFAACQAMFQEFSARAYSNLKLAAVHRLTVDAYCMQHVDPYGVSAKSYAAHLVGLCCGVEQNGNQGLYDIIHRWLNGQPNITKPQVLTFRGDITLLDVVAIEDIDTQVQRIHEWGSCVWDAYKSQHEIAHQWADLAFKWKEQHRNQR